jgi:hypothetical protein
VRPAANFAYALAVGIETRRYARRTTKRRARAAERILSELARTHPGWGGQWQSALWVADMGIAAMLLRDRLARPVRAAVSRIVAGEANRFIGYEVPYYRRNGVVLTPGDTKAEENAWNAKLLAVAVALMPRHRNQRAWARTNRELLVSALARPQDARGRYRWLLAGGSNINADYTVTNHGVREHPDYAAAVLGLTGAQRTVALLAGRPAPEQASLNRRGIYRRLVRSYGRDGSVRRDWHDPLIEGRPPFAFAVVDRDAELSGYGGGAAGRWYRVHVGQVLASRRSWAAPYGEAWNRGILAYSVANGVLIEHLAPRPGASSKE